MDGFVPAGDTEIYYRSEGEGPAVVFLHAGVADSRMWDAQMGIDGHRCVAFDRRGFGKTKWVDSEFSNVADSLLVMDTLGLESAVLVGSSMGGKLALHIADAAPDRVDGLVLVGADAPGFESGSDYESPQWAEAVKAFDAGDMTRVAELETEIWLVGRDRSPGDLPPDLISLGVDMDLIALASEDQRESKDTDAPLESVPDVDVHCLVIVGRHDLPQLLAHADHLAETLSDQDVVLLDSAHLPSLDQADAFNEALTEFLDSI